MFPEVESVGQKAVPILYFYFILFLGREWKGGRKRGREALLWERNDYRCLPHAPWPGTELTTQAHAMTTNWTGDLLTCEKTLNQQSHTDQGKKQVYLFFLR